MRARNRVRSKISRSSLSPRCPRSEIVGRAKSQSLAFLTISQVEGNARDATRIRGYFFFFFFIYREIAACFLPCDSTHDFVETVHVNRDATGFLYQTFSRNALYNAVYNHNWK